MVLKTNLTVSYVTHHFTIVTLETKSQFIPHSVLLTHIDVVKMTHLRVFLRSIIHYFYIITFR